MQINWRQVADDVILYGISPLLFTCAKVQVWNPQLFESSWLGSQEQEIMPKIFVADPIGAEGVDILKDHAEVHD